MFRSTFKEGRYEVLSRIGLGGMAEVFRVYDTILEVERALKVLNVTASPQVRLRIEREAKVMAKLTHSNIVRIIDLFAEDGIPCIVMELCSGSIAQWVYEHGPMPPRLAVEVLLQTLQGLEYAHKKGIVHRDIKPQNLLLTETGIVKIADFGLAWFETDAESLTNTGAVLGTLGFMSPEQRQEGTKITEQSDIYSAACTLVWMVLGRVAGDLYVPSLYTNTQDKFPRRLQEFLQKSGAYEPEDRYTSKEMRDVLQEILQELPQTDKKLGGVIQTIPQEQLPSLEQSTLPASPSQVTTASSSKTLNVLSIVISSLVLLVLIAQSFFSSSPAPEIEKQAPSTEISYCTTTAKEHQLYRTLGPRETLQGRFADVDQDGFLDALFINQLDQSLSIYWGNQNFGFSDPSTTSILRSGSPPTVEDINGDGKKDIILLHRDLSQISILHQDTPRSFSPTTAIPQTPPFQEIVLSDIDANKTLDLFGKQQGSTPQGEVQEWYGYRLQKEEKLESQAYIGEYNGSLSTPFPAPLGLYRIEDTTLYFQHFRNQKIESRESITSIPFPRKEISALTTFSGISAAPVLLRKRNQIYEYYTLERSDWCLLYASPDLIHDMNDWNQDGVLDILYSKTCAGCTSNHMLGVGIKE